ncbi:MAG: peptidylprolyl isomerase [Betaproteobacteria bacterium]|nr:peptidylprolyl isomerase [Betaproteobacteria bacterium]
MTTTNLIQPGSFLTLHYRLSGPKGDIINTFSGPPATLSLGNNELSPAIEARMMGLAEGEHVTLELPAGEAFGEHNPAMLQWVSRQLLSEFGEANANYQVGEVVEFSAPDKVGRYAGAVQQVGEEAVLFDFNHPLAGQAVSLEIHVIGVL